MSRINPYTPVGLDRLAARRTDEAWLAEALTAPDTRLLPLWRGKNLITGPRAAPRPVLVGADEPWWRPAAAETVLLGAADGACHFAIDLSDWPDPAAAVPELKGRGVFVDLRTTGPLLPADQAALLAYARAILGWHRSHRHCSACGHATASRQAGFRRDCANPECRTADFPRTDPTVIVLVHHGDRVLLGRQRGWPRGMHSLLAGFVEPGESLEGCVAREVAEEAGVAVTDIAYHSSQPWPFPRSVMIGFTARALGTRLMVDAEELESAAWFDRAFLGAVPADATPGHAEFALPRPDSIARRILGDWLNGRLAG